MKDKKKISVMVLSVFAIVAVISVTYAFISQTLTGTKEVVINAGTLDLVLEEENAITISNALPMYDEVGMIQEEVFIFRLVNKTNNPTNYVLKLQEIQTGTLDKTIVKYGLIKGEERTIDFVSNIVNGVIDEGTINGNETINYELRLWIDSSVTSMEQLNGKFLSFKLAASARQETESELTQSFVSSLESKVDTTSIINFAKISSETNGRGIYKYKEAGEDIYYWRGKVDEVEGAGNHVIFGGFCWEMVRTTKTGGVKMIYDGTPVEVDDKKTCPNTGTASQLSNTSTFNTGQDDNAYVGYMYGLTGITSEPTGTQCIKLNDTGNAAEIGTETSEVECVGNKGKWVTTAYESTHANVVNSTIKTVIDEWFSTSSLNTQENLEKIEDAVYCNDRRIEPGYGTGTGYGTNQTGYMARYRLYTNKTTSIPDLSCSKNDSFTVSDENGNGDLTYPVGLLIADEMVLAGTNWNASSNNDFYLYTGHYYWALSPNVFTSSYASEFGAGSVGFLSSGHVYRTYGVRPVVSLAAGTTFSQGDGTESAPYIVLSNGHF